MPKERFKRKRLLVFGFEGKNNKTETNYFSHFKPKSNDYIIKMFSCGVTDPVNMIRSAKTKRKDLDYNSKEDLTFLFIDCDCNKKKREQVESLQSKQGKDLYLIKSNPTFELWFLNHFCETTKEYKNNVELEEHLSKFIPNYEKNKDYFNLLIDKIAIAINNSEKQFRKEDYQTFTEVINLINKIICPK